MSSKSQSPTKVTLVTRNASKGGHSIEQVFRTHATAIEDIQFESVPVKFGFGLFKTLLLLARKPLIHVTGDVHWIISLLFWKSSVLTIHDLGRYAELDGWKKQVYRFWWFSLPLRFANRITVVSEYTRGQLTSEFPTTQNKTDVIYNSVPDCFSLTKRPANPVPRILQVGTAIHKNAEATARALAGTKAKLVLIGAHRESLSQLLKELRIDYTWRTNIPFEDVLAEYHACDLVSFPSRHEGFGMPVIEAQAIGRPVVTTRRCSLEEVGGNAAIYVDPDAPAEIATQVKRLLADEDYWQNTVTLGQKNTRRFTPERTSQALAAVYYRLSSS